MLSLIGVTFVALSITTSTFPCFELVLNFVILIVLFSVWNFCKNLLNLKLTRSWDCLSVLKTVYRFKELLLLQKYLHISLNRHSNFPYREYDPFDWENFDEFTCKVEFRFDKHNIPLLQEALQFPGMVDVPHATNCSGLEALCMLLKRFAFPVRYCDMVPMFGQSRP